MRTTSAQPSHPSPQVVIEAASRVCGVPAADIALGARIGPPRRNVTRARRIAVLVSRNPAPKVQVPFVALGAFFRGDGPALSKIGAEADNKILDDPEFARDVDRVREILRAEWGA